MRIISKRVGDPIGFKPRRQGFNPPKLIGRTGDSGEVLKSFKELFDQIIRKKHLNT
jgi:hypothetical protein